MKERNSPRRPPALPLLMIFLILALSVPVPADEWQKGEKAAALNIAGAAGITVWGIANWDYFDNKPKTADEGWFSENSPEGGADKCAHFYFSYTLSHGIAAATEHWGYSRKKAAALGALSSFGLMGYMELGDSFSSYGFSYEDFLMNLLGSAAGYLLYRNRRLAEKIDFRMEYLPRFSDADLVSDYDHMKFLAALKLSGFPFAQNSLWRYFECHLGYYARGYSHDPDKSRNLYLGLGLNLSEIFKTLKMKKTSTLFHYYQLPYTYIGLERNLNR